MPISNQTQLYSNPAPMNGFEGALQGLASYLSGSAQKRITDQDQKNKLLMSLIPTLASRGQFGSEATTVDVAGIPMTLGGTPQTTAVEQAAIDKSRFESDFDTQVRLAIARQIAADAADPVKQEKARLYQKFQKEKGGTGEPSNVMDIESLFKNPSAYLRGEPNTSTEEEAMMDEALLWLTDPKNAGDPMFPEVAATLLMKRKKKAAGSVI